MSFLTRTRTLVVLCALALTTVLAGVVSAAPSNTVEVAAAPRAVPATQQAGDVTASLRPLSPMPQPGAMPSNTWMKRIQERGRLIVGISPETLLMGYINPTSGEPEGFDVDVAREVAKAIFGTDKGTIEFKVQTSAQRIPNLQSGAVDMVVQTMTINAERKTQIHFSEVYYEAVQKVLVLRNSPAQEIEDLNGKRICAAKGSTSIKNIATYNPNAEAVSVDEWTDCLVLLQLNRIDAISTDDTILAGMAAQDPQTKVIGRALGGEPYGIGVSQEHPEFVRFINGVLSQMKQDGRWTAIYNKWMGRYGTAPQPPRGTYSD